MSMISELVKELRRAENPCSMVGVGYYRTLYARAADTIEELSAKLVINSQPPTDVPDTNVGEYIDTGCGVEVIHTISQTKVPKHLKFTKDGEIVKDFILCKNPVGEVGYYEQVEGKFYAISEEPYKGAE